MSNFEFLTLELETAELFQTANFAEKNYTEKDYEGTLTKVRKLAENTAKEIAIKEHIVLPNRSNFNDVLCELKNHSIDQLIIESFYEIKRLGNDSAHNINSHSSTQENAKQVLHTIFIILVWYMNHYFEIDIQTEYLDFLEPQAEKLYQTAERKLIYIQTADNTSGMFPAYKDAQKIGEATAPDDDFEVDWSPNSEFLRTVGAKRINQYMKTSGIKFVLEWVELAWKKSTKSWFHDHDVHEVLKRSGIKRPEYLDGSEWFETDLETAKSAIKAVKEGKTALDSVGKTNSDTHITLRPEQSLAVEKTRKNFKKNKKMLWNAKMRFGKTLTSLELIKDQKYAKVLIMTHRPVVSDSWFEDFGKMKMAEEGYRYGSEDKQFKLKDLKSGNTPFIYFVSIQKLRYGGGKVNLIEFSDVDWDLIIIDEAHEGTQTDLADSVLKSLEKDNTKILSLSGTPFNIQDQYSEESVYTWDYTMEQSAKIRYSLEHPKEKNPYESLPKVNMFTFDMKNKEPFLDDSKSFNFREFFRVNENNEFVHKPDINAFLDNITNQDSKTNYPFSTKQYRNELRHTLWLLPGVKEANAFEKLLNEHRIFGKEYKIVNVVKDDKSDNNEVATEGDLDKVRKAIGDPSQSKTITLTVRKLTTGVNVPEWTAVLFLSNTNSAMNYLQAAFRAQTPFSHEKIGMKKNCYIFDFAPDRALTVLAESAQINSGVGKKNTLQQKEAMTQLLNFMPVLGQTDHGMKAFNVDKMLTQLKKVYAEKAVRSGFEDDSLYNDELLTLDEADLNDFNNLKAIVGKTNQSGISKKVEVNVTGLTDEEYEKGEQAQKKKPRERTTEEKAIIEKVKQAKKQRKIMISILRGISIRIPMMIYGMPIEVDKEMGIDEFVNHVDSISWEEFMPKGIKKSDFKRFAKYYDPEVFVEAGRIIRQRAKSYDELEYTERAEKIAELFGTFKNPDKETVLTPWRVVNLQLSKTIGGLRYFDENFENTTLNGQDAITWVDTEITKEVFKDDTKILDINSKTGLYPLYASSSLFYQKRNKLNDDRAGRFSKIDEDKIIQEILKKNIYVIAKTPMAKTITERTLVGYKNIETNVRYIEGFDKIIRTNIDKCKEIVEKEVDNVKFDVVIGNPPYQEVIGNYKLQVHYDFLKASTEISSKYVVLLQPLNWLNDKGTLTKVKDHLIELHRYSDSRNVFKGISVPSGVGFSLIDKTRTVKKTKVFEKNIYSKKIEITGNFNFDDICIKEAISFKRSILDRVSNYVGHSNKDKNLKTDENGDINIWFKLKNGKTGKNSWITVNRSDIPQGEIIDKYKVMIAKDGHAESSETKPQNIFNNRAIVLKPGQISTDRPYLLEAENKEEAILLAEYANSQFFRRLLHIQDKASSVPKSSFNDVPDISEWEEVYFKQKEKFSSLDEFLNVFYRLSPQIIEDINKRISKKPSSLN